MKRFPLLLSLSVLAAACADTATGPAFEAQSEFGSEALAVADAPNGNSAVVEAVSGSGHLHLGAGDYRTFTIHATKSATGRVQGTFQWRVHSGRTGSKVKGDVVCFSIAENQAWLGVLFEKAGVPDNIGKWASVRVVDNGEGIDAPPDELAIRWRAFPYDPGTNPGGLDPQVFCQEQWTDVSTLPVEAGNIQIH